ncbi:DUF397 domain-containing protein [Streptomyces sp. PTY087I2]|uniref:DUF397 domain-containing protein n=1 Tax=Streptomyces sp. PTY087I2 TaxID=1819298 RepID=UPI00080B0917|nr:DUF397 domain-containing protein [Streptomyces sp. PTY087I2]OCC07498.1 hypothetical protein A3Q37_06726 [Streptomyces sp. PTY087I2]
MSSTLRWFKSSYSNASGGECIEVAFDWRTSSYSSGSGGDCVEVSAAWRKSSHSNASGGDCVEVAACPHSVHVRDSKVSDGPVFAVAPDAWSAFLTWTA